MAENPTTRPDSGIQALLQPLLLPEETVAVAIRGTWAPIEAHDSLTQFFLRLRGRWQAQPFVMALTDRRLRWLELGRDGAVVVQRDYRLPLKGRLVLQGKKVLEWHMPGEPRRFLSVSDPAAATDLYARIDDQQMAVQRAHAHVPESVGVGVKPALAHKPFERGEQGETTMLQHEGVEDIRPTYRPGLG